MQHVARSLEPGTTEGPATLKRTTRAAGYIAALEAPALCVAAPFLLFPTVRPSLTALALAALLVLWATRWILAGETWPVTPCNKALLVVMLTIPVGVWASAFPELTLPKLTGLVLGVAAFRAVAFAARDRRRFYWALGAFGLLGLGILAVGILANQWPAKILFLQPLIRRIPRVLTALPETSESGVSPNQLAGVLSLYLPPALALAVGWWRMRRLAALAALGASVLLTGTLLLTQSRGGWLGAAVGLVALAVSWLLVQGGRRGKLAAACVLLLATVLVAGSVLALGPDRLSAAWADSGAELDSAFGELSLADRAAIWSHAVDAIQDFPYTGCGLGTFRRVVPLLYPLFRISPLDDIAHAHNIFLQTALDLGLPGLLGYLALLGTAAVTAWRAARPADPLRPVALGLLAGVVALHVYGLVDAVALGSKPGLAFWMALGLIAALPALADARQLLSTEHVDDPLAANAAAQVDPAGVAGNNFSDKG